MPCFAMICSCSMLLSCYKHCFLMLNSWHVVIFTKSVTWYLLHFCHASFTWLAQFIYYTMPWSHCSKYALFWMLMRTWLPWIRPKIIVYMHICQVISSANYSIIYLCYPEQKYFTHLELLNNLFMLSRTKLLMYTCVICAKIIYLCLIAGVWDICTIHIWR